MWTPASLTPGNIDWQLLAPRTASFGAAGWWSIFKPGNSAWLYLWVVGSGAGGSGGSTGAAGTGRAGGGGGASGSQAILIMPWALLPDTIWGYAAPGGAGGSAGASGSAGGISSVQVEPIATQHQAYRIANAAAGLAPSGVTGASASAPVFGEYWAAGAYNSIGSAAGGNGGATTGANGSNFNYSGRFSSGAGGGGTPTGNTNFTGGGMGALFNAGPGGAVLGDYNGSGGTGKGASGGGDGAHGKELGRGGTPLDYLLYGHGTPQQFFGGCGGGTNGAAGTGGRGGDGDCGCGGGGGGAGVTGGVGGKGGDGFIIVGNF